MIVNVETGRLRLQDDGHVFYQPDPTNPLPGQPVARIGKGSSIFDPDIVILDNGVFAENDRAELAAALKVWFEKHVETILTPLCLLKNTEGVTEPVKDILTQVHAALGVVSRADLEPVIGRLDAEDRKILREHQIRLGPVLVFMPALNKPAAIHLRALLWSIWNDRPVPAVIPPDGMVSLLIEGRDGIDRDLFRMIGYPVYGPRAVRIDMLDRVISAAYDSAEKGVFKARHDMAEWLGCSIPDLYAVLEATGFQKISDPAEKKAAETPAEAPETVPDKTDSLEIIVPVSPKKPDLATFSLKRTRPSSRDRVEHIRKDKKEWNSEKAEKRERHEARRNESQRSEKKFKNENKPDKSPRVVMSAVPEQKPESSPFAILKILKKTVATQE